MRWSQNATTFKYELSVPAIGGKEGKLMKKRKTKVDSDMPVGKLTQVKDFLPPPSELAKAKRLVRITIALDWDSLQFFQSEAKKNKTKYQRMIREVLDRYVSNYKAA